MSENPIDFEEIGREIGELVNRKNAAYGNSFNKAGDILKILFPAGVQSGQYTDMLCIVRIVDKLFRIATDTNAMGEDPYKDIAGYGILGASHKKE